MAGMFYTLQEVIAKLGKNEAELKVLVREGKLREFRDGTKQLYKTEDVDALAAVPKGDSVLSDSLQLSLDETGDVSLAPEEIDTLMGNDNKKGESKFKLDETGELLADEALDKPNKDETTLLPAETKKGDIDLTELEKADTTMGGKSPKKSGGTAGGTDILAGTKAGDSKISLSGESINVLGGSETEFKISDDTSGETKVVPKGPKSLDEKGKEEAGAARLDDDVNLEGLGGSGSGLLDLSLQADDTSLGAVLDDIYPESPAAATPLAEQAPAAPSGSVAEEAEKIFEESGSQPALEQAAAPETAAVVYAAEPAPDASSSIYGIILFMPLAALIYTAIVVISGYKPILNLKVLSSIEPLIWYVIGGCAGLVILITLVGLVTGGGGNKSPKPPKPPKEKKVKKDKKAKKEEPPAKEG